MTNNKTSNLPEYREKAQMAIVLANKLKAKALFDGDDKLYLWADLMWAVAYHTGMCTFKYHYRDGYNASFIEIIQGEESTFIPSHRVRYYVYEDLLTLNKVEIFGVKHTPGYEPPETQPDPHPYEWKNLFQEFIFLSLSDEGDISLFFWNELCDLILTASKTEILKDLPDNPLVYRMDKNPYIPFNNPKFHQWVNFRKWRFKTWITIAPIFE